MYSYIDPNPLITGPKVAPTERQDTLLPAYIECRMKYTLKKAVKLALEGDEDSLLKAEKPTVNQ